MAHFTRLIIGLTLAAHIILPLPAAAANMTPGTSAAFTPRSSEMPPRPPIVEKDTISRFTFAVTSDMQDASGPGDRDTPSYFRGAVEAIAATGPTAFMVVPGDLAPPDDVEWTIERYLGESYLWYPVMGNHDIEREERILWFQTYNYDPNGDIPPNIVRSGPLGCEKTTYSFDYNNAHFIVLDEFCNEANGTISNQMYNWLYADLEATTKQHIFVFGHEPAYPQPDADNGRERHMNDSLDKDALKRDLFWGLLQEHNVAAYFCGHTHTYSAVNVEGV
ncbi:MAG: metallophosphoesterase, partial [Anaerolineae bacterium]|nr:metallophosphoesterase [Anaerolineae bacterium]